MSGRLQIISPLIRGRLWSEFRRSSASVSDEPSRSGDGTTTVSPIDDWIPLIRNTDCGLLLKTRADELTLRLRRQALRPGLSPRTRGTIEANTALIERVLRDFKTDLSAVITVPDLAPRGGTARRCHPLTGEVIEKLHALENVIGHPLGRYAHTSFADWFGPSGLNERLFPPSLMRPIETVADILAIPVDRRTRVIALRTDFRSSAPLFGEWGALLDGEDTPPFREAPVRWFALDVVIIPPNVPWILALHHGEGGYYAERDCSVLV
jgi:hypothetical protein